MAKYYKYQALAAIILLLTPCLKGKAAENQWFTSGPAGGNIKPITFHPNDHNTIFVGAIGIGIYKSTNQGGDWEQLPCSGLDRGVWSIFINPYSPDTMYSGTSRGIYKSSDSGMTWNMLYPPIPNNPYALLMHPLWPNVLFAGFWGGYVSTDGGLTWQSFNVPYADIVDFAVDPWNPNTVYFIGGNFPAGRGIYKSTDLGVTWGSIQNNLDSTGFGRDLAIDPRNSQILYLARSQSAHEGAHCLSKSTNGGDSWEDITPPGTTDSIVTGVIVSSENHNTVFITTSLDGVFNSTDGGRTWLKKNAGLRSLECNTVEIDTVSGYLFLGTVRDGVYKSTNGGDSWEPISQNINAAQCHDIAISPIDNSLILASAENGLFKSNDSGQSWRYIPVDSSLAISFMAMKFDNFSPQKIYACTYGGRNPANEPGLWISSDGGLSWDFRNNGLYANIFIDDLAISFLGPEDKRIFLASSEAIFVSDDEGLSWNVTGNGLPYTDAYSALAVAPNNPNYIAVGDYYNKVFISTDRGQSWAETIDPPRAPDSYIIRLAFHPQDSSHIYMTSLFTGLWETTDLGRNWTSIMNDLPVDPIEPRYPAVPGIVINPLNPLNIFVSSAHMGIYQTHDGGLHWESFNIGLDTAAATTEKLYFSPSDTSYLIMPTVNRSVWSIHRTLVGVEDNAPVLPDKILLSNYPNPFNAQTTISYSLPSASNVTIEIFDISGRKVETLFSGYKEAGHYAVVWDAREAASGVYFYRIKAGEFSSVKKCVLLR
jgi:photosystem II stability/assembly factor-like uncharacterized protein